jgi:hypothetical protein
MAISVSDSTPPHDILPAINPIPIEKNISHDDMKKHPRIFGVGERNIRPHIQLIGGNMEARDKSR